MERSFEAEKKEKTQVFTRFDEDITGLDRRASRHRRDIEKLDSKVDKMAEWEEKCQTLTNDLLAHVQILEERDADKNGQILELTEKVLELEGRVESMSDKLCRCARSVEVVVGDRSAKAPFTGGEVTWKPVGTSWVNCGLWIIFLPMDPPIAFWVHLDCDLNMCPACNRQ